MDGKIMEKWCDIDPNELVFTFGGSYVCANFDENRSRNATMRVLADGYTLTDANLFHNLSHAICYGYGTANKDDFTSVQRVAVDDGAAVRK